MSTQCIPGLEECVDRPMAGDGMRAPTHLQTEPQLCEPQLYEVRCVKESHTGMYPREGLTWSGKSESLPEKVELRAKKMSPW